MTLHRYFARRFLWTFLGVFAIFFLFVSLLDLVDQMRRFAGKDLGFSEIFQLTLLNAPESVYQIVPLIMILATIGLFVAMARSSELVVARAAGRSGLSTLVAPATVAFVIGALVVGMMNPIVAATSKRYYALKEAYKTDGVSALSIGREGLWLRQSDTSGQTVIHADRANPDATILYDVSFVSYATGGGPTRRIVADSARLVDGAWQLRNAKAWPLIAGINPEQNARDHDRLTVPSSLTREGIRDSFGRPSAVSIWELPAFIRQLEEAGFSARRHQVWLQMELARPLFLVAMVLVGAGFTMRHQRGGGTGIAVLSAVLLGFGLYFVRNFAQILGENGQIPAMMAAWAPPVASMLLAIGLILHMEDG